MRLTGLLAKCWLSAVLCLVLASCISHKQYRTDYQPCVSPVPEAACAEQAFQTFRDGDQPDQEYMLGFIEFDDQGQLWDRKQMELVRDQLAFASADSELLIVLFVHGWKHSAKPEDSNIQMFRQSLRRLSALESALNPDPRKVAGVYLGWRGGSVSLPLIKELSFWDRKNTAHKVGYGGVTEVLSRLELLQKAKKKIAHDSQQESSTRLVVVGHSFGGAVVFSALSELLENGFVQTHGPDGVVSDTKGFGDLVVLINPAFEATRFATLSDMANERASYFPTQLPALAVLTSEADNATKYAFPGGRWFSTLFEKEREVVRYNPITQQNEPIDQGSANLKTIGHFADYNTHYLRATGEAYQQPSGEWSAKQLAREVAVFFEVSKGWENDAPGSRISFHESILERSPDSAGRNPFLNIKVDKKLIPNHNDINDPRVQSFIRQLILLSSQSHQLEQRHLMQRLHKP
jgi:hypothetical protein